MELLVLDIETDGLDSKRNSIVEIGVVILDTNTGIIGKVLHCIVNEEHELDESAWIFGHSTLTYKMVKEEGFSLNVIRSQLQTLLKKYPSIAYNCKFDFSFLKERGFDIPKVAPDPMFLMTDVLKIKNSRGGYKWPTVQECLNYFGIKEAEPHRAQEDAVLEARIIFEMIKKGIYKLDTSIFMADTPELKILRFKAKIESYDHLLEVINEKRNFCVKKIAELEPKIEPQQPESIAQVQ